MENSGKPSWLDRISTVVAILSGGIVAAAVGFLFDLYNPVRGSGLTVWLKKEIPVSLPVSAPGLPLTLSYKGEAIHRGTLLDVNVSNLGWSTIGGKDPWILTLYAGDKSRLVLLPNQKKSPSNLDFQQMELSDPSTLRFRVGIMRSGDFAEFQVFNIDPGQPERPAILAEATRVAEVPSPIVTRDSLARRVENRISSHFRWPFAAVLFPVILVVLHKKLRAGRQRLGTSDYVQMIFVNSAVIAALLVFGLSWIVEKAVMMKLAPPS
jgi:hypothetical protein